MAVRRAQKLASIKSKIWRGQNIGHAHTNVVLLLLVLILQQQQHHCCHALSTTIDGTDDLDSNDVTALDNPRRALVSPSPRDYNELYKFACYNNYTARLSNKSDLVRHYSMQSERVKQFVASWDTPHECRREITAWRFKYADEREGILVRDRSLDERAANVLYMTRAVKFFSTDMFTFNWGDARADADNMRRVAGPKVNDDLCGDQLRQMLALAKSLARKVDAIRHNETTVLSDQHLSLARVLDSFGRYDSGLLFGKIFAPGSYHQCIWNKLILGDSTQNAATAAVSMRFCWAHLSYKKHLDDELRARTRTRFETPGLDALFSGICIPESCHSRSFSKYKSELQELVNTQYSLPRTMYVDEHMDVSSVFCLVDEGADFGIPLVGKLLIAVALLWCALVVCVTVYMRLRAANDNKNSAATASIMSHLDLANSWRDFTTAYKADKTGVSKRTVELDTLNIIKAIGCAFVVLGHTMALYMAHTQDEVRILDFSETEPVITLVLGGTVVVDTFFVITGILWAYFTLKRLNKRKERQTSPYMELELKVDDSKEKEAAHYGSAKTTANNEQAEAVQMMTHCEQERHHRCHKVNRPAPWRDFCVKWLCLSSFRYLRIVPLYALIYWFKKYVFIYSGSGPFWDHGLNEKTMAGSCHKESALTPFTFLAAYYPLSRQCIFPAWSVANDIFFALLAPPVILLMNKRPRTAGVLSVGSCLLILLGALYQLLQVPPFLDEELKELRVYGFYRFFDHVSHFYTAPHYRIFCFLAGVWAGYFLYVGQRDLDDERRHVHHVGIMDNGVETAAQSLRVTATANNNNNIMIHSRGHVNKIPDGDTLTASEKLNALRSRAPAPTRIEWPFWLRRYATWASFGYMVFLAYPFAYHRTLKRLIHPFHRILPSQFASGLRILWAVANAIIFLRMTTDWKDSWLMRVSASRFWQIFTKLNYAMLLIHLDLIVYTIEGSPSLPDSITKWGFFSMGAGIFMICIPVSLFLHLFFENPISRLIRSQLPAR